MFATNDLVFVWEGGGDRADLVFNFLVCKVFEPVCKGRRGKMRLEKRGRKVMG